MNILGALSKLVVALRSVFADVHREINDLIYQALEERGIPYEKEFDFYGLMEALVRKFGLRDDDADEAMQVLMTQMFAREEGSIFDLFDPARGGKVERWFYTAVQRRIFNVLNERKRHRQREVSIEPGENDDNEWGIESMPAKVQDLEKVEYRELVSDLQDHLKSHRFGPTLLRILEMLMEGWQKTEIAQELGFKSSGRLSYYIKELQNAVREFVAKNADPQLARALAIAVGR